MRIPAHAAVPCATERAERAGLRLWTLRAGDVDPNRLELSLLDAEERRRAAALRRPGDRHAYLAAHVLLRQLLGERLGVAPAEVAFQRRPCASCGAPHGRPELSSPAPPLHFSISYSRGIALIGLASVPVGVDVELLPEPATVDEVSALLHPAERAEIASAPTSERLAIFARVWTRKEAYLKGIGLGLTADLAADYLGSGERPPSPRGWSILDVRTVRSPGRPTAAAALMDSNDPAAASRRRPAHAPAGRWRMRHRELS